MAIKYVGVKKKYEEQLDRSQKLIRERISAERKVIPSSLFNQLTAMLDPQDNHTVVDLHVTQEAGGYWGFGSDYVELHPRCFEPWREKSSKHEDRPRLTAVLLHELVHVAGGEELDAEFFENCVFRRKDGAVPPTEEDENDFKDNRYAGQYVCLDPVSRQVTDLQSGKVLGDLPCEQVAPSPERALIPSKSPISAGKSPIKEEAMANGKQEELANMHIQTLQKRKKQVGVRIVVEFTGYMQKADLNRFMTGIRNAISPNIEGNGGNGH